MSIIDRYLLRQFFKTFFICFLSLIGLIIVFDAFTNMEEFIRSGEKSGGVLPLMARHYSYQSFGFFDWTNGMITMVAVMFTVAWLQRHNEMTALMAAGISRVRIVKPLLIAAVFVFVVAALNREFILPRFREQLSRTSKDLLGNRGQVFNEQYDNETEVLIGGTKLYADEKRIEMPVFSFPSFLSYYGKKVTAKNAYYRAPEAGRPGGYLCDEVKEPKNLETRSSLFWKGKPVLITPFDAPDWLKPNQCFIVSNRGFDQLKEGCSFRSLRELVELLQNSSVDAGPSVRIAIHARLVQPLLDMTLLFLGLPLILRRDSRNVFLAIGMCMLITTLFTFSIAGIQSLGAKMPQYVSPTMAAWGPLILFIPPAVCISHDMWE